MDHDQGRLARLDTLPDYTVADGDPDVRGWTVVGPAGDRLGEVMHLIVDPAAMAVRYVEVELAPGVHAGAGGARRVLVHVEDASIDEARNVVIVQEAAARAGTLPPIPAELAGGETSGSSAESSVSAESRLAAGSDGAIRVVLMREELVITKRLVAREEIVIRKRAVTEERIVEADLRRERLVVEGQ